MSKHTTPQATSATTATDVTPTSDRCEHASHPAICAACYRSVFARVAAELAPLTVPGTWDEDGGLVLPGECEEVELSILEGLVRVGVRSLDPESPAQAGALLEPTVAVAMARRLLEFAVEADDEQAA